MIARSVSLLAASALAAVLLGCSHELQVKNLSTYNAPLKLGTIMSRPKVAIVPFTGSEDDLFYFNAIVERLSQDPGIGDVRTDYISAVARPGAYEPDLIVEVRPKVDYRSSGWNFVINWPGFLIFTPAWNGYVYHADVMTSFIYFDSKGSVVDQLAVPMSFSIRQAEMDRTIFTGLTWLEVSALALFGGIYNSVNFDRDIIPGLQSQVKDTYANYTLAQAQRRVQGLIDSGALQKPQPEASPAAAPVETSAAPSAESAPTPAQPPAPATP